MNTVQDRVTLMTSEQGMVTLMSTEQRGVILIYTEQWEGHTNDYKSAGRIIKKYRAVEGNTNEYREG